MRYEAWVKLRMAVELPEDDRAADVEWDAILERIAGAADVVPGVVLGSTHVEDGDTR